MTEKSILQLMDLLSERSNDSKLGDDFWADNQDAAAALAFKLNITPLQAVLLSICLRHGPRNVDYNDISRHLDISNIRALEYSEELNVLIRARYLKFHDAKDEDSFDVPRTVIRAFKNNDIPELPKKIGLNIHELFDRLNDYFEDLDDNAIAPGELYHELKELFEANEHLSFVRELGGLKIDSCNNWMVLVIVCHYLINKDDDRITFGQIEDVFRSRSSFNEAKTSLKEGTHFLMQEGLVEHVCENGIANTSMIHLTTKARQILLSEFQLKTSETTVAGLTKPESLIEKTLFYTDGNEEQVDELESFLMPERYKEIRERMKASGYRSGFACLFYGSPGTGKTETVYQLARKTRRSILAVNVPEIKSKWVGDSEKNIKAVFDRYRLLVQRSEMAPILLFNEADAIFGQRMEGAQNAVDKMENSIQNIILQEMESLDGILIATTNLTQNLDSAFERRFLYKICFDRPDVSVREKIWHTMIPSLSSQECHDLAVSYELSGGQMENVSRKFTINAILHGDETDRMEVLRSYCGAEKLENKTQSKRIGF
ncbi:MAG: AAA family ATPase [Bacteroidales bacterium]|nr:AAA family ATPase [Bacteroidales bacterium]